MADKNPMDEAAATLQQMKSVMDAMVAAAKDFAKQMKEASSDAASFGGGGGQGGAATGAVSGPSASAGQGGNTGAAASVGLKLGSITVPGLRLTPPGSGGSKMPNVGQTGSNAIRGGTTAFNRVIAPAAEAGYDFARTSIAQASDRDFARYRAGLVGSSGSQFDRLVENIGRGTDLDNLTQAADVFLSSGYAARAGGLEQFGSITSLGLASGMGSAAAMSTQLATQQAGVRYGAMAAGISTRDAYGNPLSPEAIINQITGNLGLEGMSEEELARELTPGVGHLHQTLTQMGFTDEMIETYRPGIIEGSQKGPLEEGDLEDMEQARSAEKTADIVTAESKKTGLNTDAVVDGLEIASEKITAYTEGLVKNFDAASKAANTFGAQMDVLAEEGLPKLLAAMPGELTDPNREKGIIDWDSEAFPWNASWWPGNDKGSAEGDMDVSKDETRNVHAGEMIVPARIATAVRQQMAAGRAAPTKTTLGNGFALGEASALSSGGGPAPNVTINVHVQQASEAEAMRLASMVQRYLTNDRELSGLSLGQVMA